MPMKITFELSDSDLDHFRKVMARSREASASLPDSQIIENARALLYQVWHSETSDFIRERMHRLETMISMVVDEGWALEAEDRSRALQALLYFSEPEDLIPDDIPGLGFLDDAIMIDMVTEEMQHEIQAYRDFCVFRDAEASSSGQEATSSAQPSDWLEERRQQLHTRMRRRRQRGRGNSGSGSGSSFSLF